MGFLYFRGRFNIYSLPGKLIFECILTYIKMDSHACYSLNSL
jgi:hypothetical protein